MISDFTLLLYVFMVGLELNPSHVFPKKRKYPLYIGFASVLFPFIIGLLTSFILNDEDNIHGTKRTITHMLYIGLVLSISALPVLSRIISELGLLQTNVGASSVSIIAVDNILCWGLLVLVSSFINSTDDSLSPLYIFLCLTAAILIILLVIRPLLLLWLKHYQAQVEQEGAISEVIISAMFILLLLSSWTAHRFGGHAVIGSFLFGLILPHGPFTVKMTEKVEDVVVIFLLPMYIAVSGLRSNFDFTSDYMFWVWLVLYFVASSIAKIVPTSIVAKSCKFSWRESFSIGILLNTKGLMDLVVLNMGLDSEIISHKTYTLFILITILTTFSTTPLISKVYSQKYRIPILLDAPTNVEFNDNTEITNDNESHTITDSSYHNHYFKLLITVTNTKSLPGIMTMLHILNNKPNNNDKIYNQPKLMVHSIRVMEFSERSSSIQMATDATTTTNLDPISTILRTFGQLNNISIIANLTVARPSDFSSTLSYYVDNFRSNLLIIPYDIAEPNHIAAPQSGHLTLANIFENPNEQHQQQMLTPPPPQVNNNFLQPRTVKSLKAEYLPGICQFLKNSICPVGIFIDRGFGQGPAMMLNSFANSTNEMTYANTVSNISNVNLYAQTVMIIFIGGPDDREALKLVTRIAKGNKVHVIVKRIRQSNETVKTTVRETTNEYYEEGTENLTFQPSAIKNTSLQTYQKMISTLSERKSNNNSNRSSVDYVNQERKDSNRTSNRSSSKKENDTNSKYGDMININISCTSPHESNNNISKDGNDGKEINSNGSVSRKNSSDSISVVSKPSIAISISSSEKSSIRTDSNDKLPLNENRNNQKPLPETPRSSSMNDIIIPSKKNSQITTNTKSTTPSKANSLIKRGTFLHKYIKEKKNTLEDHFSKRSSFGSIKKKNENEDQNNVNKSSESFSIEIEVDTYEDRAAFNEIKKLIKKGNSHLSIEDVFIGVDEQLNDICIDLAHSIGKKDLLIVGRENILPELKMYQPENADSTKENDIVNAKPPSETRKRNESSEFNSYDFNDNTESNIQKTVSSFVTSHFYGNNNSSGNINIQEETRLRTMAGSLGYRIIKESSASVMIVQASKYKGYDRTMEDISEMEEEKFEMKREKSRSSLRKLNSFKDHFKLSAENLELRNLYKRKSGSLRSGSLRSSKNENLNAITIKHTEDKHSSNHISLTDIAKDLGANSNKSLKNDEDIPVNRSANRIAFDPEDKIIESTYNSNNNINIMNNNSFSRVNTLSKKDEIERERIKQIIKDRDNYLEKEIQNIDEINGDIADNEAIYFDSGDELDNISDTCL